MSKETEAKNEEEPTFGDPAPVLPEDIAGIVEAAVREVVKEAAEQFVAQLGELEQALQAALGRVAKLEEKKAAGDVNVLAGKVEDLFQHVKLIRRAVLLANNTVVPELGGPDRVDTNPGAETAETVASV